MTDETGAARVRELERDNRLLLEHITCCRADVEAKGKRLAEVGRYEEMYHKQVGYAAKLQQLIENLKYDSETPHEGLYHHGIIKRFKTERDTLERETAELKEQRDDAQAGWGRALEAEVAAKRELAAVRGEREQLERFIHELGPVFYTKQIQDYIPYGITDKVKAFLMNGVKALAGRKGEASMLSLHFQNPMFHEGLNVSVRRGDKYGDVRPNADLELCDIERKQVLYAKVVKVMFSRFDRLTNQEIEREHDPGCRTVEGLLAELKRVYPGFQPSENVMLLYFEVEP